MVGIGDLCLLLLVEHTIGPIHHTLHWRICLRLLFHNRENMKAHTKGTACDMMVENSLFLAPC